jgi:glycosyl transferase family 7 (putative galactosyltransferase)
VDGFDATYNGWGLEDSDLLIRLLRAGIRRKDGNFATGVLHLWHAENDRSLLPDNQSRLDAIVAADRVRSIVGISALQT